MPPQQNIELDDMVIWLNNKAATKSELLETMGEVLYRYKQQKSKLKEEDFTLLDIANFIHTELTTERENNLMFLLLTKFKETVNAHMERPSDAEIDPKKHFKVPELESVFQDLCDKNKYEIMVMTGFVQE